MLDDDRKAMFGRFKFDASRAQLARYRARHFRRSSCIEDSGSWFDDLKLVSSIHFSRCPLLTLLGPVTP